MKKVLFLFSALLTIALMSSCNGDGKSASGALSAQSAAEKVYVAPGEYDEFYAFMSGGFSGQVSVYGLPSGRLFKVIPVFSVDGEKGYGFNEETKPLLETSHGFVPWDDAHHPELSQTDGRPDGRWLFINGNNTPRIARIDLRSFETAEIIEIPNSGGNHSSPFVTENSEYVVAGTRFSLPIPQKDVAISSYQENFNGSLSFISLDQEEGHMEVDFQILMPGFDYDLAHAGKGNSHGWMFFTTYNSEQSHTLKEVNASQNDKDFIAAVNWKKAQEYIAAGNFQELPANYHVNRFDENSHMATSEVRNTVRVLIPEDCPGLVYYLPTPKSPHGVDVDPSGEYIIGNGKLNADLTVHSFTKMISAIEQQKFDGEIDGIPVLSFDDVMAGTVSSGGLGPLHTEFDGEGNAYTTFFISSEVVKWKLETWEVLDRIPTYYSVGHLMIPGGDSRHPWGKYMVALNKITKDRYLPTGPELAHSAQLYDISGEKMELLLDFPTIGEPHYAQAIAADIIMPNSLKIYPLEENTHPYVAKVESDARVERDGAEVHVYMTTIRSHFAPDNIEGVKVGDKVYFHVTNLEQDWDVPHGFAVLGANNAELLIMPGQTETLLWEPKEVGVYPFYCTDFCSALHQEMQGYIRVSPEGSNVAISATTGE
ncbi:Sec-dependent nitrous-oxide reductase [Phaeocystidibacter marisrubri]|uniref:Sec-dependent nitrous-oxide reductase n=1 Tax=Phaeocystidibacter marisrubri TaxID=1577780 RepID=A0A6L3ZFX2_9FLAO|nr:Sec-dependent nitrous-oxide reductase [Phaeocystidibacter marisrubri]KAB2816586.1 Sec-dependent nitrous-oxide reductase [Phaeocystidibacter marisrubri]GGH69802.1 nitrous-oxide reductase [Phaeocystidibacter marisrubri]